MTSVNADARLHSVIVGFAGRIIGAGEDDKALAYAADHGWVTPRGEVTADGRRLADALIDQSGARSVFRNI
jgi:hypothetical protein